MRHRATVPTLARVPPEESAVAQLRLMTGRALALEPVRSAAIDQTRLGALAPLPRSLEASDAALLAAIVQHRLVDLLEPKAAVLGFSDQVREALATARAARRRALLVQQLELGEIQQSLSAAGIDSLVLKGLPLAVQTTGDPGARGAGDIDLLVSVTAVADVRHLLLARGLVAKPGYDVQPGTWAWRHVLAHSNSLSFEGALTNVDVHWRLDSTYDALPDAATVMARRATVDVGGFAVDALGPRDLLAQSCFHAAKDRWRWLRSLVDIYRLARLPESWEGRSVADLSDLERRTLTVAFAALGTPDDVPADLRLLNRPERRAPRYVAVALAAQRDPAQEAPIPGVETIRLLRYLRHAGASRRDLGHGLLAIAVPTRIVAGVSSRSAWTGVPAVLLRRLGRGLRDVVLRRRSAGPERPGGSSSAAPSEPPVLGSTR